MVESREPRACRNHVSSPARKNTGDFTRLFWRSTFFLSFSLFSSIPYRIAIHCFYRFLSLSSLLPSSSSTKNFHRGLTIVFFLFFFFGEMRQNSYAMEARMMDKRRWRGGEAGWNYENRHAHGRDTHVRSTRHAVEHYGFRRLISTSRTNETRRKHPIARPRPDRKENSSRLIPRFRKRWRDSNLFFLSSSPFHWGWR